VNDKHHSKPDPAHHQQNPQNQDPKKHTQNPNDPPNGQRPEVPSRTGKAAAAANALAVSFSLLPSRVQREGSQEFCASTQRTRFSPSVMTRPAQGST